MKDRALKRRLFKTATYTIVAACVIVLGLALHFRISGTDLVSAVSAYRQAANRNIILISVGTLRADYLGCYGASHGVSPAIDGLAGDGLVFERAYSSAPWTTPAYMTMMTGLVPSEHGINPTDHRIILSLNPEVPTLAEMLQQNHYYTAGFTGGGFVNPDYGFHQGFDVYEGLPAGGSIEKAKNFIEANDPRRKFFLFVHTYEVHDYFQELGGIEVFSVPVTDESLAELKQAYIERIATVDRKLKSFLLALKNKGYYENSLIIFNSDHGEAFYEHNLLCHANSLYDEVLRVPLIIVGPKVPTQKRSVAPVSFIDIMPSILDWAGIKVPTQLRGRPVIDLDHQSAEAGRSIVNFSESALLSTGGPMHSIFTGRYKYVNYPGRNEELLFDLIADPEESVNLIEEKPLVLQTHRMMAREFLWNLTPRAASRGKFTEELSEQLKALGYIQ